jgi:hypothetical protein
VGVEKPPLENFTAAYRTVHLGSARESPSRCDHLIDSPLLVTVCCAAQAEEEAKGAAEAAAAKAAALAAKKAKAKKK